MNELLRACPVLIQRTNLDVNLAVNNLLSRDEEDGDDDDASQSGGKFFLRKSLTADGARKNVPTPVDGVDLFAGGGGSAGGGGGGGGENYVPEDLISLLDAGINSDHPSVIIDADAMFSEEMFSYSGAGQQRATLARSSSSRYHSHDAL